MLLMMMMIMGVGVNIVGIFEKKTERLGANTHLFFLLLGLEHLLTKS